MTRIRFGYPSSTEEFREDEALSGSASDAVKLEYALKCMEIKEHRIQDLELQLHTKELEEKIQEEHFTRVEKLLGEFLAWRKNQKVASEMDKSTPSLKHFGTPGPSLLSNKPFMALLISFCVALVVLLLLSSKHGMVN